MTAKQSSGEHDRELMETPDEPLVRNFGNAPDSKTRAQRFARSATRQARKGIRYEAGQVGGSWVVRRITSEEG